MVNKKRFIVFVLVFLFSFNMIFYSPSDNTFKNEPVIVHAEVLTLTTGLILAICTVLTACGIVITTPDMARDMAQRVYDGVKDIPGAITQVGNKVKFNLVKGVLDVIKSVVASLPDAPIQKPGPIVSAPGSLAGSAGAVFYNVTFNKGFYTIYNTKPVKYVTANFRINDTLQSLYPTGYTFQCPSGSYPAGTKFSFKVFDSVLPSDKVYLQWYVNDVPCESSKYTEKYCYINYGDTVTLKFDSDHVSSKTYPFGGSSVDDAVGDSTFDGVIDIPYSPDITGDVDYDTKPEAWFPSLNNPVFGGSVSVPMDQPLPDISVDVPWTSPNDFVADNDISIDAPDTSLPDNSVDSDSILDKILDAILGFFTGFWDIFSSLLGGLLAPIVGLLQFIYDLLKPIIGFFGDILKFLADILSAIVDGVIGAIGSLVDLLTGILDFLLSLVDALVDALVGALEGLFVPTIDLSKAFEIPENVFVPFHKFEFDDLFSITPKPIRFSTTLTFGTIVYPIKLYFDEISVISDNIGLVRNLFSYSLLLASIYAAIAVFLPKRVMD